MFAKSDDIEVRQKLVDSWRKYLGHQNYTAENVHYEGYLKPYQLEVQIELR